jgi:hypothetical protein
MQAEKARGQANGARGTGRVTCPRCRARLEILETASGGRSVSVISVGTMEPRALERFIAPEAGPDVVCPACELQLDPAAPYRGERRGQPRRN